MEHVESNASTTDNNEKWSGAFTSVHTHSETHTMHESDRRLIEWNCAPTEAVTTDRWAARRRRRPRGLRRCRRRERAGEACQTSCSDASANRTACRVRASRRRDWRRRRCSHRFGDGFDSGVRRSSGGGVSSVATAGFSSKSASERSGRDRWRLAGLIGAHGNVRG